MTEGASQKKTRRASKTMMARTTPVTFPRERQVVAEEARMPYAVKRVKCSPGYKSE